jgi:hypothetical protein
VARIRILKFHFKNRFNTISHLPLVLSNSIIPSHCLPKMLLQGPMYKEPSMISRTGDAIWSKTSFGPTSHHHTRSRLFSRMQTVPGASATFKLILEVIFYASVQHRLRFCLDHLNLSKWQTFGLIFNCGKQTRRKCGTSQANRVGGGRQIFCFWWKLLSGKESVRESVVVIQQPVVLSPTFGAKSSLIFTVAVKRNSSMRN